MLAGLCDVTKNALTITNDDDGDNDNGGDNDDNNNNDEDNNSSDNSKTIKKQTYALSI